MALKDDLKFWAKLDETSGNLYDEVGEYEGTNYGCTLGVTGKINNCISLDSGMADGVHWGDINDFNFGTSQDFSISFWFKSNASGFDFMDIIQKWAPYGYGWGFWFDYSHDLGFYIDPSGGSSIEVAAEIDTNWLDGNWHHLCVVCDRDSHLKINCDNGLDDEGNGEYGATNSINANSPNPFLCGGPDEGYSFYGEIDEIAVWHRALSASEVEELWNSGAGLSYEDVTATNAELAGSISGQATVSDAGLQVTKKLAGSISGTSIINDASLSAKIAFSGSIAGEASVSDASLQARSSLAGTITGQGQTQDANLEVKISFDGTIQTSSTVANANLAVSVELDGDIFGQASVTGDLSTGSSANLEGSISGQSTAEGDLRFAGGNQLSGTIEGGSTIAGSLSVKTSISGSITGQAVTTADIIKRVAFEGSITGSSETEAESGLRVGLYGEINAQSLIEEAMLLASGSLAGYIEGIAAVTGILSTKSLNNLIEWTQADSLITKETLAASHVTVESEGQSLIINENVAQSEITTGSSGESVITKQTIGTSKIF